MSHDSIEVLPDRWIVHARQAVLTKMEAHRGALLRLEFSTGLILEISGRWRASTGSPRTGPE